MNHKHLHSSASHSADQKSPHGNFRSLNHWAISAHSLVGNPHRGNQSIGVDDVIQVDEKIEMEDELRRERARRERIVRKQKQIEEWWLKDNSARAGVVEGIDTTAQLDMIASDCIALHLRDIASRLERMLTMSQRIVSDTAPDTKEGKKARETRAIIVSGLMILRHAGNE